MDIRTKFVFALVAVSLGSMLALGAFTYDAVEELLRSIALRQLDALAEGKKQDLEKVAVAWHDRVKLITSRTQLHAGLRARREDGDAARETIQRNLTDALESVRALRGVAVYGPDGYAITSVGLVTGAGERVMPATFWMSEAPVVFENVSLDPDGKLLLTFVAPIREKGRLLGGAKVLLSAQELEEITQDYTGLGETGETLIALRTDTDGALILNSLRHDPDAALKREIARDKYHDPIIQAVRGSEGTAPGRPRDYRGEEVWAARRHLPEFDWGLVVKIDRAEEALAATELRNTMAKLAVSLSAFGVVAGTLLGFYFARPIRDLAEVARRIHEGELDLKARADSEDEVGLLARTFNEMTEKLIRNNRELERRVRESNQPGRTGRSSAERQA